jgi:hypothetical protein
VRQVRLPGDLSERGVLREIWIHDQLREQQEGAGWARPRPATPSTAAISTAGVVAPISMALTSVSRDGARKLIPGLPARCSNFGCNRGYIEAPMSCRRENNGR